MSSATPSIAILGSGNVGTALATLLEKAGLAVTVGSHNSDGDGKASFEDSVSGADVVFLAIPFTAVSSVASALSGHLDGKVVVDCTNPLDENWGPVSLGENTSAAEKLAGLLPQAHVVKAFNTVFADVMTPERQVRDGQAVTVFVAGDDAAAKETVESLAKSAGFSSVDAGPLSSARYLEAMAHLNIQIAVGQGGGTNAAFVYHQIPA